MHTETTETYPTYAAARAFGYEAVRYQHRAQMRLMHEPTIAGRVIGEGQAESKSRGLLLACERDLCGGFGSSSDRVSA